MRFAWLRQTQLSDREFPTSAAGTAVLALYNLVWWLPMVLSFTKLISYRAGFIGFLGVTLVRALVNAYRVNVMAPEKAVSFPLRIP